MQGMPGAGVEVHLIEGFAIFHPGVQWHGLIMMGMAINEVFGLLFEECLFIQGMFGK